MSTLHTTGAPQTIDRIIDVFPPYQQQQIKTQLSNVLEGVISQQLLPTAEITLEANPGTVETERFCGYREAGVNRLSLGIQSFDTSMLQSLGRIHGGDEALRATQAARAAGFNNLNLDLMYALPRQSLESALRDVDTAIAIQPTHLSIYQLTIEPNTRFHATPPPFLPGNLYPQRFAVRSGGKER